MHSLVDQFCPNVHDAPITAAVYDIASGTIATADSAGVVAVQRPGEAAPGLLFQPGGAVQGALALVRGGSMVAVGDDDGTDGQTDEDYSACDGCGIAYVRGIEQTVELGEMCLDMSGVWGSEQLAPADPESYISNLRDLAD